MSKLKTKLTAECFPYPMVYQEELGGYWEYTGDSVREWRACALLIARTGERMKPLLGPPALLAHIASLDLSMVLCLLGMIQQHEYRGLEWLRYSSDFPRVSLGVGRGFSTNYNYLIHFGLAEKRPRKPQKSDSKTEGDSVEYRITEKGRAFVSGTTTCPEYVVNRRDHVLDQAKKQVSITDFLKPKILQALGENPLWWEDEKDRAKYLKSAYAPVDWSKLPHVEDEESEESTTETYTKPITADSMTLASELHLATAL